MFIVYYWTKIVIPKQKLLLPRTHYNNQLNLLNATTYFHEISQLAVYHIHHCKAVPKKYCINTKHNSLF